METRHRGLLLVIEDGDEDYEMLRLAFEQQGIKNPLRRCCDAEELYDFLEADPGSAADQHPCLILLDLNLPGVDGRRLLQELRRHWRTQLVPIVAITQSNNPRDVALCYRTGANCYAVKPLGTGELRRLVRAVAEFWLDIMELPPSAEIPPDWTHEKRRF